VDTAIRAELPRDLVLVGAGHAHVQVLRRWMMKPVPSVRLTLVLDCPEAVYSGMVPGFVAGDYEARELEIDAVPLARRARARIVLARAVGVDPEARRVAVEGRAPLSYDFASLDVGSSVRGLDLPGVVEHALVTRPIRSLVGALEARLAQLPGGDAMPNVCVVGGGAAGVELCFALDARLRAQGRAFRLTLVCDTVEVLPGHGQRFVQRARREAESRGVRVVCRTRVERVGKGELFVEGEREPFPADLVLWATGAAPVALGLDSRLPRNAAGFVRVRDTLEVEGCPGLFAAGDCAGISGFDWVPKAGVYAVREGPVLDANLRRALAGRALRRYRPQTDFLALLNLGDRRALGEKRGCVAAGPAVWRLKDWIDRRFMRRFQVLDAASAPARDFPSAESMGMESMDCGGCAATLGATGLDAALARLGTPPADEGVLVGLARPDDSAALALSGGAVLLATIDGFRAFCDDPWLVGRVAAVNALGDVFAKGGRPRHALALVTVPDESARAGEETLYQVLAGVRAALDPLGVSLVGGHTTRGPELFVGLAVTGDLPAGGDLLSLDGARPGDVLVLTRPLGSGVLLAADMQGLARGAWVRDLHASLVRSNQCAAEVARSSGATASTDVSGFGLAGHLAELLRASGVSARVRLEALAPFPGALELLARGLRSSYHEQNESRRRAIDFAPTASGPRVALLFDPQTAGGLLLALPPERVDAALAALHEAGDPEAVRIGEVTARSEEGFVFSAV
jgi:selenide,water dikinase